MLLSLAVVVILGSTSVLGGNCPISCPPSCIKTWTSYPLSHVNGLEKQDDITSEQACKDACEANPSCKNIDWNFDESTGYYQGCWFGYQETPDRRDSDSVNHYDLKIECTENCNVRTAWKPFPGTHVKYLVRQYEITSLDECKAGCISTPGCTNIDWNFVEESAYHGCYFGNADITVKVPDVEVDHYDLVKECASEPRPKPPVVEPPVVEPPVVEPPVVEPPVVEPPVVEPPVVEPPVVEPPVVEPPVVEPPVVEPPVVEPPVVKPPVVEPPVVEPPVVEPPVVEPPVTKPPVVKPPLVETPRPRPVETPRPRPVETPRPR